MVLSHRHPIYGPTLPNEMFTLGKAFGGAKDTSDPSAVPTDPFGRIRHEFRTLGSTLDRFDASVKSALRKIPGSRMPPPRAEARAAEAARAPKPGLFDRLRSGAKGKARATSEPEKDSRRAQKKEKTPPRATKKETEKTPKTVPATAPAEPAAVSSEPAEAPRRTKRPTKAVVEPPKRLSAKTKKRADDSEVRDYISRSYAPRDADEKKELAPAKKESASVNMPPKPPQKVTFADLDDADKSLVARARAAMAAMAHVEPTRANLVAGAAAILAAHVLAKAWRARGGPRRDELSAEEKFDDDIDSAFGTPTRAGAVDRRTASSKGKAPAPMPATGTASAKRLIFRDEETKTAAALRPADVNRAGTLPARASSSKQNRFGVGADALAAAVRAKTTVIKATRRLKRSGELRVDVLEATFLDAPEKFDGDASAETFTFRVAVDADKSGFVRGSTPARAFDNKRRRDVVTFNSRLAFSLPASSDGHAGKRVEARLCDGAGRTVAKTAVLLRAALRAAPVTKSFPLHDRAGAVVGQARLAIEWDYAEEEQDAKENEVSAAAKLLAAVKE